MVGLFLVLGCVIGAYWYMTDSDRVKAMAEGYLSGLLGGRVEVRRATLSIFEGLRLDDVRVYNLPGPKAGDPSRRNDDDTALFSAQAFVIQYNPQTLFSGKLEATRIIAIAPSVHLTEDAETGRWSFQRLRPRQGGGSMSMHQEGRPPVLPEILLRNASVEYIQMRGETQVASNSVSLEGQFSPGQDPDTYHFRLQSRGEIEGVGPSVDGTLVMGNHHVKARLSNFVIGPDVKAMLASEVRKWVEDHQLAGAIDADLDYRPEEPANRFVVRMDLGGVTAVVRPEEWMSEAQVRRLHGIQRSLGVMQLAGLNSPINGFSDDAYVDHLRNLLTPQPIHLDALAGQFIFTQQGIDIPDARGRLELNGFKLHGHIDGYSASAKLHLRLTSPENESVFIPAAPRYVSSMPAPVREIYDRFKPQGKCSFWVDIDRAQKGAVPVVAGELEILDGQFSYEKFAYPVQHVTGKIAVGPNADGEPSLRLEHLHGHGIDGGPNANADFEINGWMAPLTQTVQIVVDITGHNVCNEPALTAAYPRGALDALRLFDSPGRGEYPRYRGDFAVRVTRDLGKKSHWTIDTNFHVADASGSLVAFPYPISGVTADVHIRGDHLDVTNARMRRGDAEVNVNGTVDWGAAARAISSSGFVPRLHLQARGVPIDQDLLAALPPERRALIGELGVAGMIDVDGQITAPEEAPASSELRPAPASPVALDLGIALHHGSLTPFGGAMAVRELEGNLRLGGTTLAIERLKGKRDASDLTAHGSVDWSGDDPQVNLSVQAQNLQLDPALHDMLPRAARGGWDVVHPSGTADVNVDYNGGVAGDAVASSGAEGGGGGGAASEYAISITPRQLSAELDAVPYRLDNITGTVAISPDQITLNDITAHHGGAIVHLSGTGNIASGSTALATSPSTTWDLHLAGEKMLVDADLKRAVPKALDALLKSLELRGEIGFDFSRLLVTPSASATQPASPQIAPTRPSGAVDVDFALRVKSDDASINVGIPLAHVAAVADLSGLERDGKLDHLSGTVDADRLSLAQRPLTDLHLELSKPAGADILQIQKIQGRIAGGEIAGQVEWAFPEGAPSRYAIGLVLQGADVKEMSGDKNAKFSGTLGASLAVEGNYNDASSRQGRGDVEVVGSNMYQIPLVLGLLQVTNLAMPITSPFSQATARYSIQGQRVTFEQIELHAQEMVMQGTGHLDFDTKRVGMTFTTDNTTWPKLPIIGDLISSARHELLQINVAGTLQEPKVSARSLNTFTTTIDQVLAGGSGDVTPDGKTHKGY